MWSTPGARPDDLGRHDPRRCAPPPSGADLLLTSGGVSVGDEDHVKPAARALGRVDLWGIDMKPGRPVAFGRVAGVPWLGLPGNPAAGSIAFLLFAAPLLRRLAGRPDPFPRAVAAGGRLRARPAAAPRGVVARAREGGRAVPPRARVRAC